MKAMRDHAVAGKCGDIGTSTVWRFAKEDPTFPKPFKLSARITVWDEADIDRWLASKKEALHET